MIKAHLKRPDIKPRDSQKIGQALELVCGKGLSILFVSHIMKISHAILSRWLTKYWFYQKIDNPVIIKLNSKV